MSERESTLSWSDCYYLHRLMSQSQERLMKYACGGFKKQGLNDDQTAIISLMLLKKEIDSILERNKEKNG